MCDAQTWISIADAAILLKVKPATVLRRIEKGTLPARRSVDMPFTYDGKENYEVRLDALPPAPAISVSVLASSRI